MTKAKDNSWMFEDARDGKKYSIDDLAKKEAYDLCKGLLSGMPAVPTTPPESMSVLEIVLGFVICHALARAKHHKIRSNIKQSAFIVGYLSSKINLKDLEIKWKGKKVKI